MAYRPGSASGLELGFFFDWIQYSISFSLRAKSPAKTANKKATHLIGPNISIKIAVAIQSNDLGKKIEEKKRAPRGNDKVIVMFVIISSKSIPLTPNPLDYFFLIICVCVRLCLPK